jgi:hypothetical protein
MNEMEKKAMRLKLQKETVRILSGGPLQEPDDISGAICSRLKLGPKLEELGMKTTCQDYEAAVTLLLNTGAENK